MREEFNLDPIPAPLAARKGVHPRLFLDAQRIQELRQAITTTHAALWDSVREQADQAVRTGPPAYIERDRSSGDEQLWQREVGNKMPLLAMAYRLSGEQKYLDSARQWALASCAYRTWGLGRIDGMDLAAGHQLFGLGIVYDWCYDDLGEAARSTIRATLIKRTSAMYEAAATGKAWWRRSYLQNHLWVNICAMATVGMALYGEAEEAPHWIALPLDKFRRTMDALGDDGASHEGTGYWQYGVEYLLKFMDLARELLGVNLYDHPWWRHTADYRLYLALPRHAWTRGNNEVDLADCPRGNWYGPDYLLRALAREYRDGHAQWLAQEIDTAKVDSPEARWLNLIWYDPKLRPVPPTGTAERSEGVRPTLHHFPDMGIVSARTNWSGDESLVVFKCGPFIGHKAVREFSYDPGGGHVHPDANHFLLFGNGEWLIRDDGYGAKWTGQHNTLLIGGKGQTGEGQMWFNGTPLLGAQAQPQITRVASSPRLDEIVGEAAPAYPAALGLKRYTRRLLFLKPDTLIVVDDIELAHSAPMELRFHPEAQEAAREGNAFLMRGKQSMLRLEPLTTGIILADAKQIAAEGRENERPFPMLTIQLRTERPRWRNAVALTWSAAGAVPAHVTLRATGDIWTFQVRGQRLELNWRTGKVSISG
jgi:Domain of unknown function (DUF4962)/Heparinase II/III-like protein